MIAALLLAATTPTYLTIRELTLYCTQQDVNPMCRQFIWAAWTSAVVTDFKTAEIRHVKPAICAPQDEPPEVLAPRVTAWLAADLARFPADADEPAAPFIPAYMLVEYGCPDSPYKK